MDGIYIVASLEYTYTLIDSWCCISLVELGEHICLGHKVGSVATLVQTPTIWLCITLTAESPHCTIVLFIIAAMDPPCHIKKRKKLTLPTFAWLLKAKVMDEGLCRVGWSTQAAKLDGLGTDNHGFGYGGTGKKSYNRQFDNYGGPYGLGDTIGCLLDCDNMEVSFSKNGRHLGVAFEIHRNLQGQVKILRSLLLKAH